MSLVESLVEQLNEKAQEAEAASRRPDPERDPGGKPDILNEQGRIQAAGRAEAFREAAQMVAARA